MSGFYVGLDWDKITLQEAQRRASDIKKQENATVTLYRTKHGYHAILRYPREITAGENIRIRKGYGDDPRRLKVGIKRYKTTGRIQDLDVLFTRKNGHMRQVIL